LSPLRRKDFLALARLAARCADEKKAEDVTLLDLSKTAGMADYFLLASVESQPQMQAVYDHIMRHVRDDYGLVPLHRDGIGSPQWTVVDYGGLVVHLFHQSAREFYGLERLWGDAKLLEWREKPKPAKISRHRTRTTKSAK